MKKSSHVHAIPLFPSMKDHPSTVTDSRKNMIKLEDTSLGSGSVLLAEGLGAKSSG